MPNLILQLPDISIITDGLDKVKNYFSGGGLMFEIDEKLLECENFLDINSSFEEVAGREFETNITHFKEESIDLDAFDCTSIKFPLPTEIDLLPAWELLIESFDDFIDISRTLISYVHPLSLGDYASTNASDLTGFDNVSILAHHLIPELESEDYDNISLDDFWDMAPVSSESASIASESALGALAPEDIELLDNVSIPMPEFAVFEKEEETAFDKVIREIEGSAIRLVKSRGRGSRKGQRRAKTKKSISGNDTRGEKSHIATKAEYDLPLHLTIENDEIMVRLDLSPLGDLNTWQASPAFLKLLAGIPSTIRGKHFRASLENQELCLVFPRVPFPDKKAL